MEKPAVTQHGKTTLSFIGDLAGYLPRLQTHDMRRGGAKDLARLGRDVFNEQHHGIAMGSGHANFKTGQVYNGQMDAPLSTFQANVPVGPIDKKLLLLVYIGSGTHTKYSVLVRWRQHDRGPVMLGRCHYMRGMLEREVSHHTQRHPTVEADSSRGRNSTCVRIALEAMLSFHSWAMRSREKDYKMGACCSWNRDDFTYHGLCSHNAMIEMILGDFDLTAEQLGAIATEVKERSRKYRIARLRRTRGSSTSVTKLKMAIAKTAGVVLRDLLSRLQLRWTMATKIQLGNGLYYQPGINVPIYHISGVELRMSSWEQQEYKKLFGALRKFLVKGGGQPASAVTKKPGLGGQGRV
ncbi:hypothetical protein PV11_09012 [Exophiala sideris]|uniref:Uncharacterized protein n=1 Tax=Exophiala sideris TaxID=1016849 RepID=A0A0D1YQC7_9EURO|nr:hypothetical protein PV11_09012 [Exophiala sideris]